MALTEQVILDTQTAQRQITALQTELAQLSQPVDINLRVDDTGEIDQLRRDIQIVDNETINIDVDASELGRAENEVESLRRELGQVDDEARKAERDLRDMGDATLRVGTQGVSAFTNLRSSLLGVGAALVGLQGAQALFRFFGESIEAASNLEESTSKARVVFGEFSEDIEAFAASAPQALGLANQQALEFAGTFGNLFTALGLTQQAAAQMSSEIVTLGADLASFNNLPVTDALDKLRAGLVGEAEPLRALGVNINEAATQAKALELGLVGANGAITDAAKVQARYALILEQTTNAQGDFARTSDSIANRQRVLSAEFDSFRASVGEALLPVFEALIGIAPTVIDSLESMVPSLTTLATQLGSLVESSVPVITFLSDLGRGFGALGDVIGPLAGAITTPIEGLRGLLAGDITGPLDAIAEGFTEIGRAADNIAIRVIEQDIVEGLRAGIEPLDAFAAALGRLQEKAVLNPASIQRFVSITGVGLSDALRVLILFRNAAGTSDKEVDDLTSSMRQLLGIADAIPPPLNEIRDALANVNQEAEQLDIARNVLTQVEALEIVGQAADEAGLSIVEYITTTTAIPEEIAPAVAAISGLGAVFLDQVDANRRFTEAFQGLAGAISIDFDPVVDEFELLLAVTDKAGREVPATVKQIIDDLRRQTQQVARLEAATTILDALGFNDLAANLRAKGPEAADAAEGFVADIASAIEAESLFDEGGTLSESALEGLKSALAQGDITPELLDLVAQFTSAQVIAEVIAAAAATGQLFGSELNRILGNLPLTLRLRPEIIAIQPHFGPQGVTPSYVPPSAPAPTGGNTYNSIANNFYRNPEPTTDTARITQTVNSLVS